MRFDIPGIVYLMNAVDKECRACLPMLEKVEATYDGKVRITRVDIYKSTGIAARLGVTTFPCYVTIKDGHICNVIDRNLCESEVCDLADNLCKETIINGAVTK